MEEKIKDWWIGWDMTWADVVIALICLVILYFIVKNYEDVFAGILIGLCFGNEIQKAIQQRKKQKIS